MSSVRLGDKVSVSGHAHDSDRFRGSCMRVIVSVESVCVSICACPYACDRFREKCMRVRMRVRMRAVVIVVR